MDTQQTWIDIIQLPIFTVIITSLLTLSGALITQLIASKRTEKIQQIKLNHESELERKQKELDSLREMQKAMYTYYESHTKMETYFLLMGRNVIKEGYSFELKNSLTSNEFALDFNAGQNWRILQNIYGFGKADIYDRLMTVIEYKRDLISQLSRVFYNQDMKLTEVQKILFTLNKEGVKGEAIFKEYEKSLNEYAKLNL